MAENIFNYFGWHSQLFIQVVVPASLLFLTQFRLYLFCVMPVAMAAHGYLLTNSEKVLAGQTPAASTDGDDAAACQQTALINFELSRVMWTNFFQICCISAGIFSTKDSLVHRFITNERSQNTQMQLTNIFNKQVDGFVVLKEQQPQPKNPTNMDESVAEPLNGNNYHGGGGAGGASTSKPNNRYAQGEAVGARSGRGLLDNGSGKLDE